ncbi:hypothetical protein GCM10010172_17320 [Paractinoplanes ferrugineus]|uniref:DUF3073 domain-containing protein n=2 Tax=Paractinoplanes ferrugineus TaxID=113564 RepID=A0A919MEG6_9ACTN|nr:hypothetical protein Afe05nite_34990 [Actinoplanes ferrugineus]
MPDVIGARLRAAPNSVRGGRAMGRGRAKAKQTKVARELKYHSPNTDLTALQRELAGASGKSDRHFDDDSSEIVDDDEDDADDDQDTWSPTRR